MRSLSSRELIGEFMRALGKVARTHARVYFTGGSTAVLFGWREMTLDIDIRFVPEADELFRALTPLKEKLHTNVELASPPDFIPEVPGWEDRSIFIAREGNIDFFHFDPYSQTLSKLQRHHAQDIEDADSMFSEGLIELDRLAEYFGRIKAMFYKYPAIDPAAFERSLNEFCQRHKQKRVD
ncbi:MAG: hypothetical protein JO314_05465 [Acidobacteria bacterium]|nr:hypothetical protein [Acidobacteriota bacterium]